jgi:hypothetical protein
MPEALWRQKEVYDIAFDGALSTVHRVIRGKKLETGEAADKGARPS